MALAFEAAATAHHLQRSGVLTIDDQPKGEPFAYLA